MIISNSSPLIYLAKLKKLSLLKALFKEIVIPAEVYEEVVSFGKKEKLADAFAVEQAHREGWIHVERAPRERTLEHITSEIDKGEVAVLELARKHKAVLVLLDDASARTIAESLNLRAKGTLFVLLRAYKKKLISKEETKRLVAQLVREGFRISQELYVEVLEEIERA